jgi:hypothetical protein
MILAVIRLRILSPDSLYEYETFRRALAHSEGRETSIVGKNICSKHEVTMNANLYNDEFHN